MPSKISDAKVLIVDDAEFSREVIGKVFEKNGFSNINFAENGIVALQKTEEIEPDIVLLDLIMPELDGYEYCKRIRTSPKFFTTPILVQSAADRPDEISKAFQAGATDFVSKPINADEVMARSRVHLENKFLMQDLTDYRRRVESELKSAKETQKAILPSDTEITEIQNQYGMDIEKYFEPSSELGGDFWGIKGISHNEVAFYTVDFSGHGVTAALNTFRIHTILQEQNSFSLPPGVFLSLINSHLNNLLSVGQFATMFYGVLNTNNNTFRYSSAGAPNPIVTDANGKTKIIDGSGVPLGISKDALYENKEIDFPAGSVLMLYSDALLETRNDKGDFLQERSFAGILEENKGGESKKLMQEVLRKFSSHAKDNLIDDLTINIYRRLG